MTNHGRVLSILATIILAACGGGGNSGSPSILAADSASRSLALASMTAEPASANCASGGSRIDSGLDLNGNGLLDPSEIRSTQYVCNGSARANGLTARNNLAFMADESAGSTCSEGGKKITSGLDTNANGILDAAEITATTYVCNQHPGVLATGIAATDGRNTLVAILTEPVGVNCAGGGQKVTSGVDANANGVLDSTEVTSTSYVCNGSTGPSGALGVNGITSLVSIVAEPPGANCVQGGSRISAGADTNANGVLDGFEIRSVQYVCNGANGTSGAAGASGVNNLVAIVTEAPGAHCATGGNKITAGADGNANGVLDSSEVTSTSYVCNGTAGVAGTNGINGTNGTNGTNGSNTLLAIVNEPVGVNCANAGKKITSGVDSNANGVLDVPEVMSTSYVCNGLSGSSGTVGANGLSSLLSISTESAGINCIYGGQKVASGADSNGNGVLDPSEITATSYVCNGAPGPGVTWVDVTGTAVQAASNVGYLAHNTAQVAIALPTSPAVGDIVGVSGAGAGGWKIVQNAGQTVKTGNLQGGGIGTAWTARDSNRVWYSVASSADGTRLVGVVYNGQIYTSADSGVTWTARDASRVWYSVASSSDGANLAAVDLGGQIYTSTDYGVTWTARASAGQWVSVASSADGSRLVAVEYPGQIRTSIDFGVTWTVRESARLWRSVASSSDGTRLVAVDEGGLVYTSTDSGVTWTGRDSSRPWRAVASSADGMRLVAVATGGQIYTSTDAGLTWTAREAVRNWWAVTSSSDGTRLVAVVYGSGQIFSSTDSGVTWTARESVRLWDAVASSSDGTHLVAADRAGKIYVSNATALSSTATGVAGTLSGRQYDAINLQYVGSGVFIPLSAEGTFEME